MGIVTKVDDRSYVVWEWTITRYCKQQVGSMSDVNQSSLAVYFSFACARRVYFRPVTDQTRK
jgi:hypothetical protein